MAHRSENCFPEDIRAVSFDASDTLIYAVKEEIEVAFADFCRRKGHDVPVEAVRKGYQHYIYEGSRYHAENKALHSTNPREYLFSATREMLLYLGVSRLQAEELAELAFKELELVWHLFPGVEPILRSLKAKGLKLGVISNWGPRLSETLARLGIRSYFSTVIASEVVGISKPDPGIFCLALEKLECQARNALHVGDSYSADVLGALNAGMKPVLLDRSQAYEESPCARISSLSELASLIA